MHFFQHQAAARRRTLWLLLGYAVAFLVTGAAAGFVIGTAAFLFVWYQAGVLAPASTILGATALVLAGMGAAAVWRARELRRTGGAGLVAKLGGKALESQPRSREGRRLRNVVEEMAVAAGIPAPWIFVLPKERRINAFIAGWAPADAAIAVSAGALAHLRREELEGVVAHEIHHLVAGDTRLNMRFVGLLHGLRCLGAAGDVLFEIAEAGVAFASIVGGVLLHALGAAGEVCCRLFQSALSRTREYAADAGAVAFTRNPGGLAGALKKIGGSGGGRLTVRAARGIGHMLFVAQARVQSGSRFATHPPLALRIRRLDRGWDGTYPEIDLGVPERPPRVQKVTRPERPVDPTHLAAAHTLLADVGPDLRAAVRTPAGAAAFVHALQLRDAPEEAWALVTAKRRDRARALGRVLAATPRAAHLPLLDLAVPGLRALGRDEFRYFRDQVREIAAAVDARPTFGWLVERIVTGYVADAALGTRLPLPRLYGLARRRGDASVLLSAAARHGHDDEAEAARAVAAGAKVLGDDGLTLQPPVACTLDAVDGSLEALAATTPRVKQRLLKACAATLAHDTEIGEAEAELWRGIAHALRVPAPLILEGPLLV